MNVRTTLIVILVSGLLVWSCGEETKPPAECSQDADCDDGNPCTDDACEEERCRHIDNQAPCDDGDPCTDGDVCRAGACVPGENVCACGTDADCEPLEDDDLCNGTLACVDGFCRIDPETVVTCDPSEDSACERNTCEPATGACHMEIQPDGTACDDGDACTRPDVCTAGGCGGAPVNCDDGDPCSEDDCVAGACVYEEICCDDELDNDGDGATDCDDGACDGDPACNVQLAWKCTPLGTSYTDGFFSLEAFGGKLYAGLFGYGRESQSMLYSYPPFELTSPGLTGIGESVCALKEFDGHLYANTENSGDIFRSSDGSNWQRVHDGGSGTIGCGLEVFNGKLYAINYGYSQSNHGKVLRMDGSAWTTVYDSGSTPLYVREIVAYAGKLWVFAVQNRQGQMLSSSDGETWAKQQVANRYFRGHVWNGYLWLGSTDYSADGEVGVWRFDGSHFVKTYAGTKRYVTDIEHHAGNLFAGTSNGWKNESGPCSLIMSPDGETDWQTICTFPETAVWSMAVFDGDLYLGTWDYQSAGKLYKVSLEPITTGDCSAISANPAWELCESGENYCAGVYTDGAGCVAFCAAAGLECTAKWDGNPGCQKVPIEYVCGQSTGNMSDWCECGVKQIAQGCDPFQGSLSVGQTYTLNVDGHTGDEETTQPKTDANDGQNGDNPRYRRHNVARAHNDYWYTSSYQVTPGEPDPNAEQWVDYVPDFATLGVGCYNILAQYRGTDSRATYPAQYRILDTRDGDVLIERVQERVDGAYVDEDLGNHFMCTESTVRIQDTGPNSITFNKMRFTYLGSTCP